MTPKGAYDDILYLSRPEIPGRARMSAIDRAAQFSPFAALTGYEAVIHETARRTARPVALAQDRVAELDALLQDLARQSLPQVELTVFCPDARKEGGSYQKLLCRIRCVDAQRQCLVTQAGQQIPFDRLYAIEIQ